MRSFKTPERLCGVLTARAESCFPGQGWGGVLAFAFLEPHVLVFLY